MSLKSSLKSKLKDRLPLQLKKGLRSLMAQVSPPPLPVEGGTATAPSRAMAAPPDAVNEPEGVRLITTMADLDRKLKELDRAALISDDALRREFRTFRMDFRGDLPADPWSEEYRQRQFEHYELIAGKPYEIANEVSPIDVAEASNVPFPYITQSCRTVGDHLIAIGFLMKVLDLAPGSSVLEFGPGWGNTTETLARMGHRVTAVDIERNFIELIDRRAEKLGLSIDTVLGDFQYIEEVGEPVDAVLFFECFHHCSDHIRLIRGLDGAVAEGGRVVFAAEPISDAMFPMPWGIRVDGESLWAIRRNGWLELGFREDYFRATLDRYGWGVERLECPETPWGVVFVATRK